MDDAGLLELLATADVLPEAVLDQARLLPEPDVDSWQADYLALLVQRDLPTWGFPARPQMTSRLLRMIAATHGQTWNASGIGKSLGLSYHTVNRYLDYLVGAFLIRQLAPYHALREVRARRLALAGG